MLPRITAMGLPVSSLTRAELAEAVRRAASERGATRCAVAANVHTWAEARRHADVEAAFREAWLVWPDGVPITWAARWLATPVGPRIHGHDLMRLLFREPLSHFFYGSTSEVLRDLERSVRREWPSLRIAGTHSPPFTRRAEPIDPAVARAIEASGADILWVGLGAPKQELWMQLNRHRVRVPIMVGVGAAFEILAGRFSRAPWMLQKMGLEWAWRMMQDPGRLWRRYFSTNGYFLSTLALALLRGK